MPKLWNETIAEHRHQVRDAILDSVAALIAEEGMLAVTMSQIAQRVGIGRATLYKYFADVESILLAWHERHVSAHLEQLAEIRASGGGVWERLEAMLQFYARVCYDRGKQGYSDVAALVHRGDHVASAQRQLLGMFSEVIGDAVRTGDSPDDTTAEELAAYCLHALGAAGALSSEDAVDRLVSVTLAGLRG